jgi:hypothetical protein
LAEVFLTDWLGNRVGMSASYTVTYICFGIWGIFAYVRFSDPLRKKLFLTLSICGLAISTPILFGVEYAIRGTLMKIMSPEGVLFVGLILIWINLTMVEKILRKEGNNNGIDKWY